MNFNCFCNFKNCSEKVCNTRYGCFQLNITLINQTVKTTFGCLTTPQNLAPQCYNSKKNQSICCNFNLCNIISTYYSSPVQSSILNHDENYVNTLFVKVIITSCIILLLLVLSLIAFSKYHQKLTRYFKICSNLTISRNYIPQAINNPSGLKLYVDDCERSLATSHNHSHIVENCSGLSPLNDKIFYNRHSSLNGDSCTSGSGSGTPFLVQRTIAREVQLISEIGKGRFGEVWKGAYHGEMVAVKIFSSRDEASWDRETHIYNTYLLRHPNVLDYYASDMVSRFGCTQLWLITHYHPMGSLYDYLHSRVIPFSEGISLLHSTVSGLSHLHTEIISGPQGKPSIAHRDIKSKNILIMSPGEACIADLGLSVLQSSSNWLYSSPIHSKHKIGTRRYMAPEILANCLCPDSDSVVENCLAEPTSLSPANSVRHDSCPIRFEHFVSADIYAFALVMWEVISRTTQLGQPPLTGEYKVPYQDLVPLDPSTGEMRQLICMDKVRPFLPIDESVPRLALSLNEMIREAWSEKSQTRPSALRLKKNLKSLLFVENLR